MGNVNNTSPVTMRGTFEYQQRHVPLQILFSSSLSLSIFFGKPKCRTVAQMAKKESKHGRTDQETGNLQSGSGKLCNGFNVL